MKTARGRSPHLQGRDVRAGSSPIPNLIDRRFSEFSQISIRSCVALPVDHFPFRFFLPVSIAAYQVHPCPSRLFRHRRDDLFDRGCRSMRWMPAPFIRFLFWFRFLVVDRLLCSHPRGRSLDLHFHERKGRSRSIPLRSFFSCFSSCVRRQAKKIPRLSLPESSPVTEDRSSGPSTASFSLSRPETKLRLRSGMRNLSAIPRSNFGEISLPSSPAATEGRSGLQMPLHLPFLLLLSVSLITELSRFLCATLNLVHLQEKIKRILDYFLSFLGLILQKMAHLLMFLSFCI